MYINEVNLKWNGALTYNNVPSFIILHHAEWTNCTVEDLHNCHLQNGWCGIGYHYFVKKDGSVWKGRPDNVLGSHCKGSNYGSLGICAEGDYTVDIMPIEQKMAIVELCKNLCEKYGIAKDKIYGHGELMATECPGTNYPLEQIKKLVRNEESVNMEKIVVYYGDADVFSAIIVSQRHNCPCMKLDDYKAKRLNANEIIQIGGPGATAGGSDRFETFKNAGSLV